MCKLCLSNQLSVSYEPNASPDKSGGDLTGASGNGVGVLDFPAVQLPLSDQAIAYSETTDAAASTGTIYSMSAGDTFEGSLSFGDSDWVRVELTAGTSYTLDLFGSGSNGVADTVLRLHNNSGDLVAFNDDGGSGLNSRLEFTVNTGGTYYINASAYRSLQTGDYTIALQEASGPTPPPGSSPLDALDWGGSRVATTNIEVYFARAGERFDGQTSQGWTQAQIDGAMASLNDLSESTNLTFSVTNNASSAEFKFVTSTLAGGAYAYMNPPNTGNPGVAVFNTNNMDLSNLGKGSLEYFVFQHEVGHGLGMSHPHDRGGGSNVMEGVSSPRGDLGDFNLNQGIYTMMSYNVGHAELYPVWPDTFGATAGPMAFDIALLQEKYGAKAANTGNDVYVLPDSNGAGTFYSAIWDTGGTDTIAYNGTGSANISLVAATLDYSSTGGGVLSYANGIRGGFTIANGVEIENATGGSGFDILQGNALANVLDGSGGNDILNGGLGNDLLLGGAGSDRFDFSNAGDIDVIADFEDTLDIIQILSGSNGFGATGFADLSLSETGSDVLVEYAGSQIVIQGTSLASIGSDDFVFV
ncbi:peptidase M10/serralysin-like protein [Roseibium hamelinense]|uniref:Peptidase M10/serralysin-like protein n=1 Tax=Roseibium hamelinense TaxID=150831 RepID=A0A562TGN7_9HYPH|nr:M10 family metallopeptidase C-terminal domain-containing protein [Roseibium hamelinense]TWI92761.1 peptidase M10/serralysin-like protein [Roseibium hamelinense]